MFTPIEAQAQVATNIQSLIRASGSLIDVLIGVLISLALVIFLWGLARYIFSAGDESRLADAKRLMFWGIIALFVMMSVWGIVLFLQDTFSVAWYHWFI